MYITIKVLAWYTAILATFSFISMLITTILNKQPMVLTPPMSLLNLILLVPMVAFGVLVIIRVRRGDRVELG